MGVMSRLTPLGGRIAVAVCIVLSACAAAPPAAVSSRDAGAAYGAFLAARYADAQRDPVMATRYYQSALRADPRNQSLVDEGFIAALLAGSPNAKGLANRIAGSALGAMLIGNQAALQGDYAAASKSYSGLPQDDLTGLLRPILLAWAQTGAGDSQSAIIGLTSDFANPVLGPVYVLNAAMIADVSNDMKDATQLYGDVGANQPNLRLVQLLASWQARQGQVALAQTALTQLIAAHPDLRIALPALRAQLGRRIVATPNDGLAEAYLTLAGSLDQPSQTLLRDTFLRFALMLRPNLTAARLLLANSQAGGDEPAGALVHREQLRAALATLQPVRPDDALFGPAALQQANLLAALGQTDDAVALLDKLAAQNPGNPDPLLAAGDVLRSADKFAEATARYSAAIAIVGSPPPASAWALFYGRAICEDQQGNWRAAEPDLLTAMSLAPNQPYVLNYLAYSWALRGEKLDQAAALLQQASGLAPNDGAIIDSLGFVKMRQGQTKAAVSLLTQAVELTPDDAEINAHLGDAFQQAGMTLQADYQWQRALALGPDAKLKAAIEGKLKQLAGPPSAG